MTVFDVVVNTDDLVVLGPPDVIDVAISIGEQGQRGATFYAGSGNPNDSIVSQNVFGDTITPISGDMYINTAIGADYGWLYLYNPKISGNQWDQVLRLEQPYYVEEQDVVFSSGTATISVPLENILPTGISQPDPDKYIISLTPEHTDIVVLTVSSKSIVSGNLQISLQGLTYSSSTWSSLNSTIAIYIHIAVL